MKTKLKNETSELEVLISAKKENWQKVQKDVQLKLISNLSIDGFRKGKVPFEMGKRHISQSQIMQESVLKIIDSLSQEAHKTIDKKIKVLLGPTYSINKISNVDLEIKFIFPIFPNFKIGDYKNLKTKFNLKKVSDEDVTMEIERIRSTQTMLIDKNDQVGKGNVVMFDFEGSVDGKAFKGGKADKYQLEIGSGKFIPGFEEQMIGMKQNDKKDIKVTFPSDYHDANLKGKKATFKILIHKVQFKEVPKLDDNFAMTSGFSNVKTLVELKKYIKKMLKDQFEEEAKMKFQRKVFDEILKGTKDLVVPEILVNNEVQSLKNNMIQDLKRRDIEFKKHLQKMGKTEEELNVRFKDQALIRLRDAFIFAEIFRLEKIEISEDNYEQQYQKFVDIYGQTIEDIKKIISKEQIQIILMNKKVTEFLINNTK